MVLKDRIKQVILTNDSPQKIALSFGIGVFIGMSPFLGLHTILGIAVAWICNLNKFVTIAGVYVTNPWTIVPIYTFATWVGAKLFGFTEILPDINWNEVSFHQILSQMENLLLPFFLGTTLVGFISAVASYIIIYLSIRNRNKTLY